jgi:hypothetical protein
MTQLYLNEQVFQSQSEMEYMRDVVLHQECDSYHICKMLMEALEKSRDAKADEAMMLKERQLKQDELEIFFEQIHDMLLKLFQQYCSFGDPLNTDKLKSNKFIKLFVDLDLISSETNQPIPHSAYDSMVSYEKHPTFGQ